METSAAIAYDEAGLRLSSEGDALSFAETKVKEHGIEIRRTSLEEFCDLGFFAEQYVVHSEREAEYAKQGTLHFGKGRTETQARLSGLFESFERVSALFKDGTPSLRGSYNQLRKSGYALVDVRTFLMPDPARIGTLDHYYSTIQTPYHPDLELDWSRTESLIDGQEWYFPVCMTHSIRTIDAQNNIYHNRPNGMASGTTMPEAILAGICEVIERDATAIFVINSLPAPRVDPKTIPMADVQNFCDRAREVGSEVIIKDITSDLKIPTFYTAIVNRNGQYPAINWGAGTHVSKHIALTRSVTEAALDRASFLSNGCRVLSSDLLSVTPRKRWETSQYIASMLGICNLKYLDRAKELRSFDEIPDIPVSTISGALESILHRLRGVGVQGVWVANLTRIGVPAVRVIIPRLEVLTGLYYRYLNGAGFTERRLWSAPVAMGYGEPDEFTPLSGCGNNVFL